MRWSATCTHTGRDNVKRLQSVNQWLGGSSSLPAEGRPRRGLGWAVSLVEISGHSELTVQEMTAIINTKVKGMRLQNPMNVHVYLLHI